MHRNGMFNLQDTEDDVILACPNHGWKMNAEKMCYVNPSGDRPHPQLTVTTCLSGNDVLKR